MFDGDAFYYSPDGDLTNSIQRQNQSGHDKEAPLWKRADERFFWNEFMLRDLLTSQVSFIFQLKINFLICRSNFYF